MGGFCGKLRDVGDVIPYGVCRQMCKAFPETDKNELNILFPP